MKFSMLLAVLLLTMSVGAQTTSRKGAGAPATSTPAGKQAPADSAGETQGPLTAEEEQLIAEVIAVQAEVASSCSYFSDSPQCRTAQAKAAKTYGRVVKHTRIIPFLMATSLASFEAIRSGAKGAVQVSQAADEHIVKMTNLILAQNQRMIELLERLVNRR